MLVTELVDALELTVFSMTDETRQVKGGYAGDLLSWVMGRAQQDEAWVTIMSNQNIVAVATLTDVSCIILSEGVVPDDGVAETAKQRGINLLGSTRATYELCCAIRDLL